MFRVRKEMAFQQAERAERAAQLRLPLADIGSTTGSVRLRAARQKQFHDIEPHQGKAVVKD
jgi:hypothetical protein